MKKHLIMGIAAFILANFAAAGGSLTASGTCTSNKNRCDGHCTAQGGSKQSWCVADCAGRWQECMQNGTWRYDDVSARGVIYGVQKQ